MLREISYYPTPREGEAIVTAGLFMAQDPKDVRKLGMRAYTVVGENSNILNKVVQVRYGGRLDQDVDFSKAAEMAGRAGPEFSKVAVVNVNYDAMGKIDSVDLLFIFTEIT